VIDAGAHLDAVAVARPTGGRTLPSIVLGASGSNLWWWSWDGAKPA
jgi:hypothetical protein